MTPRSIYLIAIPVGVGLILVTIGLLATRSALVVSGLVFALAALLPLIWVISPTLRRSWSADPKRKLGWMTFFLFRAPLFGLPLVLVGILGQTPFWILCGGGVALFSVLSAVQLAVDEG